MINEYKLITCIQDYDNSHDGQQNVVSSSTLNIDSSINDELILNLFSDSEHVMEIYETQQVNEETSWYFLKSLDPSVNYFGQVISILSD